MGQIAQKQRVKLLLDYLSRHEKFLDEAMSAYEIDATRSVLDTWFKFVPMERSLEEIAQSKLSPDMSVEDVIAVSMRFHESLLELYDALETESVADEVKELFRDLRILEKKEELRLARDTVELEDV